jgi:hypothetical protein
LAEIQKKINSQTDDDGDSGEFGKRFGRFSRSVFVAVKSKSFILILISFGE